MRALEMTAKKEIRQGAHFIIGLPGETNQDILSEVDIISGMPINNVKFHHLQIVKDTVMDRDYEMNPGSFRLFSLEEYLDLMAGIIERLNPEFVVERIAGEAHPDYLIAPTWGLRYDEVLRKFEGLLKERDIWQGKKYGK
jgi:hypothetical protein